MCLAVSPLVSLGLSAASSVVGYIGQSQAASRQAEYQNAVYQQQAAQAQANADYQNRQVQRNNQYMLENRDNAVSALQQDKAALVAQERQQGIATALDIQAQRIDRIRAQGAIQASERAGLTLETLLADFDRQDAISTGVQMQNLAFASAQRQREVNQLIATANSRINQARPYEAAPFQAPTPPSPVETPSLLGTALNIGSSVASNLASRSVYDSTKGRYTLDRVRTTPASLPTQGRWDKAADILGGTFTPRGFN